MTKILDWRRSDDPRDVVHLAVQALAEGHVVAAPTDHAYVLLASALQPAAVDHLQRVTSTSSVQPPAIVPRTADEVLDLIPSIEPGSRRLIRKAWPGPLVLQTKNADEYSSLRCLPEEVYNRIQTHSGEVRVWLPEHEALHYIMRLVSGPLVAAAAPVEGKSQGVARTVAELPSGSSVLAIDGGVIQEPGEPTIVAVEGNRGTILQEGVVDRTQLRQLSQYVILFVCTGNTCRSPMAAALMRRKIQDQFGKEFDGQSIPIVAVSAGVSAFGGDPASHGALQAIQNYGCSLQDHQSTQLNSWLVEQSDLILAMGQRHRSVIVSQWPDVASKVHLIAGDGSEISDPFGGPLEVYQRCAEQLDRHTNYWLDHLDTSSIIHWSNR
ncbi:MAG: Sua5/YciO/YrdC/YwlC family protein [Pirellula sp.]|nr:Sua5/YciO/YrdC/YwlC family protein [Pirellula sp.]